MKLTAGWHPYRDPWIMRLSGPAAAALVIILCVSLPFLMGGLLAAIFWFLGNLLFSPHFWMVLGAITLYGIFKG